MSWASRPADSGPPAGVSLRAMCGSMAGSREMPARRPRRSPRPPTAAPGRMPQRRGVRFTPGSPGISTVSRCDARQLVRQVAGPENRRRQGDEARRGIVEDVALEATPVALIGSEVAASPAARSVGVKGMEFGHPPRGDLEHLAAIEVAGVDDEGDAWVTLEQLSEP